MTTNYWAHQDITRKNVVRAVGKVTTLWGWNCNQLTPLTDWSGFYFTSGSYHQQRFIGYFPVQIILNTCISGSLPAKWIWNCLLVLISPLQGCFLCRAERELWLVSNPRHHCVVMKGNEVLWCERTTHSRLRCFPVVITVMKCVDLKIKSKCSHSILLPVSPSALGLLSPDICWVTRNGKKRNI